jgi:hypothetical protein
MVSHAAFEGMGKRHLYGLLAYFRVSKRETVSSVNLTHMTEASPFIAFCKETAASSFPSLNIEENIGAHLRD